MYNEALRRRREARPSSSGDGRSMTRVELANAVNLYLWRTTGQRTCLDAETIGRYERGKVRWPGATYREGLRAVLGADSDAELGFYPSRRGRTVYVPAMLDASNLRGLGDAGATRSILSAPWSASGGLLAIGSLAGDQSMDGTTDRRNFLTLSAATLVTVAHEWLTVDTVQVARAIEGGRINGELPAAFEERLPGLRRIDHTLGGLRARPLVDAELRIVNDILAKSSYDEPTGQRLFAVAAELCRIAGWASCDAGEHAAAEWYWTTGLRAAHLGNDGGIGANILKSMALQRTEAGDHSEAITLVETARRGVRGGPHQVHAMLTVRLARAHAGRGDVTETERLLAQAETLMARTRPRDDVPAWVNYFDETEFYAQSAACHRLLGQHSRTDQLLERVLMTQPDDRSRDRATYAMWRAESALGVGDVDAACAHIHAAIPDLASARSLRNRERLAGLSSDLRGYSKLRVVRDLDAELERRLEPAVA